MEKDKAEGVIIMAEEKIVTINVRKFLKKIPKWRRTSSVMKIIKTQLQKQTKSKKLIMDKKINQKVWANGIENPLTKIRVKVVKENDNARAELLE